MFWGLILKHGKKYSQTVSKAFHLSAASLDTSAAKGGDIQVLLTSDNNVYILCTLNKDNDKQRSLDLNFAEGDKICFSIKGEGIVHLTGFLIPDSDDFMDMSDEEEEEADTPVKKGAAVANGKQQKKNALEKLVMGEADSESDEMDDTFDPSKSLGEDDDDEDDDDEEEAEGEEDDDDEEEDDEEDDDDDDDEEEDSDEEEVEQPAKKLQKGQDGQKVKQNGVEQNGKAASKEQQKKEKPQQQGPKTLQGGVQVQDLVSGNGPEAKPGKKVAVYYEGRLKSNNKVFDSTKKGNGFKFKLGGGEVIKGWDVGVAGMKVGGKRRITCPPHMAYGQKGSPPVIPGNATLVFDVELKNVL